MCNAGGKHIYIYRKFFASRTTRLARSRSPISKEHKYTHNWLLSALVTKKAGKHMQYITNNTSLTV